MGGGGGYLYRNINRIMKYIRRFKTSSDYEAFKTSDGYIEPHVIICEDNVENPILKEYLLFPITLVEGDNGFKGIELYNYLLNKIGDTYYTTTEEIYGNFVDPDGVKHTIDTTVWLTCYKYSDTLIFMTPNYLNLPINYQINQIAISSNGNLTISWAFVGAGN